MGRIHSLLIANRGEIAVRIARTCHVLGVRVIAVHSEADADAQHVRVADVAVSIGPAPAAESYLDGAAIIAAATAHGADAIHPGYGFLSENAGFARAVLDAGLVWVGPSPEAMELMGDKAASKRAMAAAGVPIVPGVEDDTLDDQALVAAATEVGVPLLVKAVAGGGGKGMRPVHDIADLPDAIAAARREARSAFGDDRLIVEKLIGRPRHIEIQVFGDTHGDIVHLFERECSIQRRHQKIVEEAPAPNLPDDLRDEIAAAAVAAARAVDYVGAGTVEFILGQDGTFAFLEMNTRLQVEHPVTEYVTGQDLVAWQLAVAEGQPLPCAQDELHLRGHAIEVRVYAEDPANDFLPDVGEVLAWSFPPHGDDDLRLDSGTVTGDVVSRHYDPMLAKVIAGGDTRDQALSRLSDNLARMSVLGLRTNIDHLLAILHTPAFAAGTLTTDFLDEHLAAWHPSPVEPPATAAVAAVLARSEFAGPAGETFAAVGPWRIGPTGGWTCVLRDRETEHRHLVTGTATAPVVDGVPRRFEDLDATTRVLTPTGEVVEVAIARRGDAVWAHLLPSAVTVHATTRRFDLVRPTRYADASELVGGDAFTSPMPGAVIAVHVTAGETVTAGQAMVAVEAMKMEHPVLAPADGTVTEVFVRVGDSVEAGQDLLAFEPSEPS